MKVFANGTLTEAATPPAGHGLVYFAAAREAAAVPGFTGFLREVQHSESGTAATRFESHFGFDYLSLRVPNLADAGVPVARGAICFDGDNLLFLCQNLPACDALQDKLAHWQGEPPAPAQVLSLFFSQLLGGDTAALSDIEDEIAQLEDRVLEDENDNFTAAISALRKRLLVLKRYYESLFDLLEDLEENRNGFYTAEQLRNFHLATNRADRLSNAVLNLRDHVTQVRESYQNQLDIKLNQIMKVFTVITAVFLPLSLIVGWYGMNVYMPETVYPILYPIIIAVCVVIVVGCLWYFKRHKWF
ncbi:MAG: magnesium transporter [Ruminococcaceae bacterium]|nr:magnesium transporter [Oscillospiraceae bacterium]